MSQFRLSFSEISHRSSGFLATLILIFSVAQVPSVVGQAPSPLDQQLRAPRPIPAGHSPWLEELTWMEVRDLIAGGTTTVLIPTGGIEENGPFLATGKHNLILEALCPAIASDLGNALCAPS